MTKIKKGLEELLGEQQDNLGGVNFEDREIYISGEITAEKSELYMQSIIQFNKEDDDLDLKIEDRTPIKVYISSIGGDVGSGIAVSDLLKASKTPTYAITLSYGYSMGCIIPLVCDKKYCYPNSTFLIHEGFAGHQNTTKKFLQFADLIKIQNKAIENIILENTKITKKMLNKKLSDEWYIDAKTALKLGIVDEILTQII